VGLATGKFAATSPSSGDGPDDDDEEETQQISVENMLGAVREQEKKDKMQIKDLKAKNNQLLLDLDKQTTRAVRAEEQIKYEQMKLQAVQKRQQDEAEGRLILDSDKITTAEEKLVALELEIDTLRMQRAELTKMSSDEKVTSSKLAQELQMMVHEGREKDLLVESLRDKIAEITIKGENELDTAQHERRHLQQKVTNILAKLTAEEAKHVAAANEAHNLAGNVLILTQENVALGEQLRVQEVKIREVLEAYQQREKEISKLREQNAKLLTQLADNASVQQDNNKEMTKSSEQLRQMAEKVFQLLAQIQKMEQIRVQQVEDLRVVRADVTKVKGEADELQHNLNGEIKNRNKLEKELVVVNKAVIEQTNFANELKKKLIEQTAKTEKVQLQINGKDTEIDQLNSRMITLQAQYRAVMASSDKQKAAAGLMEDRLKHSATTIISLQSRIETLQMHLSKGVPPPAEHQGLTLPSPLAKSSTAMGGTGALGSSLKGSTGAGAAAGKVGSLMTKTSSQRVSEMLKNFKIDEQTAMAMAKSPMTLLTKLADIYVEMVDAIAAANDVETVEKFNALSGEHRTVLSAKDKILKTFVSIITKVQEVLKLSAAPLVKKSTFMTEGEDDPEDDEDEEIRAAKEEQKQSLAAAAMAGDEELAACFRNMTFSDGELGDAGAASVASLLKTSFNIQDVDMRNNRIGTEGLIHVVKAVVQDTSSVVNVDLTGNELGAEAVLTLCALLQHLGAHIEKAEFLPQAGYGGTAKPAFGSTEPDAAAAAWDGAPLRPVVEIKTKSARTIYVDMSKNLFDERVMSRLVNLIDADLNDPVVRQIILAARKAKAAAELAAKNKHLTVEDDDPLMLLSYKNSGGHGPPPTKKKVDTKAATHELRRSDTHSRGNLGVSASTSSLGSTAPPGQLSARPYSSDDHRMAKSASTGKLAATSATPGHDAGRANKMLQVAETYGKLVAESASKMKRTSATMVPGTAMAVRANVHEAKELKQLPRDGVLAHHDGDGAHKQKVVKEEKVVELGAKFKLATRTLEPLDGEQGSGRQEPPIDPSDPNVSTGDLVSAALKAPMPATGK